MSHLQEINLRDLRRSWFDGQAPARAIQHLESAAARAELGSLLRWHGEREVNDDEEIAQRDDVDRFLSFCGLVELACLSGFAPVKPVGEFAEQLESLLEVPELRAVYTKHYPLRLPGLRLARLQGERSEVEDPQSAAPSIFLRFLVVSRPLSEDTDVDHFLKFLDDFWIEEYRASDVGAALEAFDRFIDLITRPPEQADALSKACLGFLRFGAFAADFLPRLEEAAGCRRMRAAMWHQHAYWFVELKDHLGDALQAFRRGAMAFAAQKGLALEGQRELELNLVTRATRLQALTDPTWGAGL